MTQTFTQDDLILHLHKELNYFNNQNCTGEDTHLLKEFSSMEKSKNNLPKVLFKPKKSTITKILEYAKHS